MPMPSRFQGVPKDKQCKPFESLTSEMVVESIGRSNTTTMQTTVIQVANPALGMGVMFEGVEIASFVIPLQQSLGITAGSRFKVTVEIVKEETDGADEPLAQGAAGSDSHATGHGASD